MNIKKIMAIVLVILWMSVIFAFSNQAGQGSTKTSNIVSIKLVKIMNIGKDLSLEDKEAQIQFVDPIIRKVAHYSIYLMGGILLTNCFTQFLHSEKKIILYSTLVGIVYAASDEVHQLFISGRSGRIEDVFLDALGVFTGVAIFLLINKVLVKISKTKIQRG